VSRLWIALAAAALLFSASPASADSVTNTFTGVVAADSGTTADMHNYFGGGSLIGDPFTLVMTLDLGFVSGQTFTVGGTAFSGASPITATLTINGITETINDSSDAFLFDLGSGTVETYQQAFNWINQLQSPGVFVDLATNVPATLDLGAPLPAMFLADGDFSNYGASFSDSGCGENLDLTVETVNAPVNVPVPEPGSLTLLAAGLVALAFVLSRHAAA
jgi:hypothetical protein